MSKLINKTLSAIEVVAAILFGAVTLLIVLSAIGRYGFAAPIPDSFDLSRLVLGVAIIWGFASLGFRDSHIKVSISSHMFSKSVTRWIEVFAWTLLLIFTAVLAWKMFGKFLSSHASGETTFDLRIPLWPFVFAIWLGLVGAIITTLYRIIQIVTRRDFCIIENSITGSRDEEVQNDV
ncbi:TRAP transporter small permease [Marinobacterium mangrovicola]|uniref:TRAP transporter small permease protein n=1 Tax=Marinobacterium mangrovicola TaxID=1476959 RepID=A0A4R1H7G3_9GAMM|nr:TRAP transporter small permease [Marinobacterium mangrovicola]TCK16391.1 TRAP-type C4-dicarboxylate transport system permease small subunit [Marinobacterium mangrovicola]